MRTTVDINPDLLERVRQLADAEGVSFKEALNRVITRGLSDAPVAVAEPYHLPSFNIGFPADWDAKRMKQILLDEDLEHYLKLQRRDRNE